MRSQSWTSRQLQGRSVSSGKAGERIGVGVPGLDKQGVQGGSGEHWQSSLFRKLRAWLVVGCQAAMEETGTAL